MVLCKFFQQGSCHFGSKCHNEHFDIKQVLKTDVESAINGKQWPLSSYGPFKDKPSIPNFIEDRCFEEVRLMCYEAKQKNFFEQFHQQFNKEIIEASNKMKALLQMTPDILDVVINVYDTASVDSAPPAAKSSNPFGMTAGAASAGSIFAKSAQTAPASNIFGGAATNTSGFASTNTGASIFSSAANNQPVASGIFGGGNTAFGQNQQQSSIFGQTAKPANSIFGGGVSATQQTSIFAQQQQPAVAGGNLFAQPQAQQQQQSSGGAFNAFSQPQQQQASVFAQPQQQTSNLFAQQQGSNNIFAQAAVQQAPQQQQQQQQGIFAQAATNMQTQPAGGQNIFAQATPTQQPMQQPGITGQGLFAQAAQPTQTQNMYGQTMQQTPQQQQQQQQQQPVMFQQTQQQNPTQQPIQNTNQQSQAAIIFKQANVQAPSGSQISNSSSLYSRMEDLSAEEIEAYKADVFEPGKLPFNPPPRELVN